MNPNDPETIAHYLSVTRQIGHTTAIAQTAATTGARVLCSNRRAANLVEQENPGVSAISISQLTPSVRTPLICDNQIVIHLAKLVTSATRDAEISRKRIRTYQGIADDESASRLDSERNNAYLQRANRLLRRQIRSQSLRKRRVFEKTHRRK